MIKYICDFCGISANRTENPDAPIMIKSNEACICDKCTEKAYKSLMLVKKNKQLNDINVG